MPAMHVLCTDSMRETIYLETLFIPLARLSYQSHTVRSVYSLKHKDEYIHETPQKEKERVGKSDSLSLSLVSALPFYPDKGVITFPGNSIPIPIQLEMSAVVLV